QRRAKYLFVDKAVGERVEARAAIFRRHVERPKTKRLAFELKLLALFERQFSGEQEIFFQRKQLALRKFAGRLTDHSLLIRQSKIHVRPPNPLSLCVQAVRRDRQEISPPPPRRRSDDR